MLLDSLSYVERPEYVQLCHTVLKSNLAVAGDKSTFQAVCFVGMRGAGKTVASALDARAAISKAALEQETETAVWQLRYSFDRTIDSSTDAETLLVQRTAWHVRGTTRAFRDARLVDVIRRIKKSSKKDKLFVGINIDEVHANLQLGRKILALIRDLAVELKQENIFFLLTFAGLLSPEDICGIELLRQNSNLSILPSTHDAQGLQRLVTVDTRINLQTVTPVDGVGVLEKYFTFTERMFVDCLAKLSGGNFRLLKFIVDAGKMKNKNILARWKDVADVALETVRNLHSTNSHFLTGLALDAASFRGAIHYIFIRKPVTRDTRLETNGCTVMQAQLTGLVTWRHSSGLLEMPFLYVLVANDTVLKDGPLLREQLSKVHTKFEPEEFEKFVAQILFVHFSCLPTTGCPLAEALPHVLLSSDLKQCVIRGSTEPLKWSLLEQRYPDHQQILNKNVMYINARMAPFADIILILDGYVFLFQVKMLQEMTHETADRNQLVTGSAAWPGGTAGCELWHEYGKCGLEVPVRFQKKRAAKTPAKIQSWDDAWSPQRQALK